MNEKWVADEIMAIKKGGAIPTATATIKGGVKIGSGIQVTPDGTISIPGTITYTITVTPGANGTITPGTGSYSAGQTATFSILPNTGYEIDDVLIDGSSVGAVSSYTFTNLANNHTVSASFKVKTYTISTSVVGGTGGSISASPTTVNHNGSSTITVTASSGYSVKSFKINGTATTLSGTTYTITNITANQTVTVEFQSGYSVTCSVVGGVGGTISASPTSVTPGGSSTITVTPATGYSVKEFKVNGTAKTLSGTTYTISSINSDQTVTVEFQAAQTGSFYIDKSLLATSPTTCVKYNDGLTQSEAKDMVWSWIKPTVVKNGAIVYDLDITNLAKKADGTTSNLTGTDGDVMVSIKPIYWKVITNDSTKLEIKISDASFDGAVTAHKFNGTVRKWLHVGMFHMSGSAAKSVYSTTATPWVSKTNDAFRTAAEAIGDTYCTMTYRTWTLIELLTVFASGSCDCQTTCGQDYTGGSAATAVGTSAMLTANGWTSSTKSSATTSLMWMYLSQPWGNVVDFISGLLTASGKTGLATDQYNARGVTVGSAIPSTWTSFTSPSASNYQKEAQGVNDYPFFPKTGSGTSSTYYCDCCYSATSGNYCAYVGGDYDRGAYAGVFYVYVGASSSAASAYRGARLQCLDVENA